jgi:hypothetical protein
MIGSGCIVWIASAIGSIVLQNSAGLDCRGFKSSRRPLVYALPFVCCGSYSQVANRGATVAELEAIFGWAGGQMAALYTRSANRRALSTRAMNKLSRTETETSIPAPDDKVRAPEQKT